MILRAKASSLLAAKFSGNMRSLMLNPLLNAKLILMEIGGQPGTETTRMRCPDQEDPVSKYNMNLRTESTIANSWPIEMEDHTALRVELARFVGELLKDHANLIWEDQEWRVDVTDERGLILYVMHISAANTAATASSAHHKAPRL